MARAVLGGLAIFLFTCILALFVICSAPNVYYGYKKGLASRSPPPRILQINLDGSEVRCHTRMPLKNMVSIGRLNCVARIFWRPLATVDNLWSPYD